MKEIIIIKIQDFWRKWNYLKKFICTGKKWYIRIQQGHAFSTFQKAGDPAITSHVVCVCVRLYIHICIYIILITASRYTLIWLPCDLGRVETVRYQVPDTPNPAALYSNMLYFKYYLREMVAQLYTDLYILALWMSFDMLIINSFMPPSISFGISVTLSSRFRVRLLAIWRSS